jgi:hypothetical protein
MNRNNNLQDKPISCSQKNINERKNRQMQINQKKAKTARIARKAAPTEGAIRAATAQRRPGG